jgi:Caspase domain/YARHG domain/Bacterial SH3 domain
MLRPLVLLFCLLGSAAHADKVALVIGNSAYQNTASLPNAATDAADMAARLDGLGFEVHGGIDLDRQATLAAVEAFAKALSPEDLALFFYAGHGAQIGTENYIIPVDVVASDEVTLAGASIRFQTILRTMELRADRRIVILDACRNNPFLEASANRSGAEPARGLAKVEGGVGTYIAFSTQPGNVALDGEGRNSPFTSALLAHIGDPGADIHAVMRKVRGDVVAATDETQVPWENSSLVDEVYLAGDGVSSVASPIPKASPPVFEPAASVQLHYVGGLDPNGDGFLALREGTGPDARRLAKMTEGTPLEVLDTDGPWFRVRLLDGREGWAHSNWIRCCTDGQAVQPRAEAGASCDELWYRRNAIWASYGYCFTSPRGIATFGIDTCFRTQEEARSAMSTGDLALVDQLKAMEAASGCQ